ncbi:MAG: hypothetical protein LUD78_05950 [Clostridiales bacterium]|nr:hypothetical protein [Clostridiales bacterium]
MEKRTGGEFCALLVIPFPQPYAHFSFWLFALSWQHLTARKCAASEVPLDGNN